MIKGTKLSNFKIEGPKLKNGENKGIKTAIKSLFLFIYVRS